MDQFVKIETRKKSSLIAEQLLNAIESGKFRVGDKLPSETDIAKAMGVSRPMVREVYSALRVAGVLESRIGHGTFVSKLPSNVEIESQILSMLEESKSPFCVLETRRILEVGNIELAVERRTPSDLQALEIALDKMKVGFEKKRHAELERGNVSFHLAIAEATQNPVMSHHLALLLNHGGQDLWQVMIEQNFTWNETEERFKRSAESHRKIFLAIESKDKEAAVLAMKGHFEILRSVLDGSLDEELRPNSP